MPGCRPSWRNWRTRYIRRRCRIYEDCFICFGRGWKLSAGRALARAIVAAISIAVTKPASWMAYPRHLMAMNAGLQTELEKLAHAIYPEKMPNLRGLFYLLRAGMEVVGWACPGPRDSGGNFHRGDEAGFMDGLSATLDGNECRAADRAGETGARDISGEDAESTRTVLSASGGDGSCRLGVPWPAR